MTSETNRYEYPLLLTFLLVGVTGLVLPQRASSNTLLTLPYWLLYVWYGVSIVGGGGGLVGILMTRVPRRWLLGQVLLRFGLSLVAGQVTSYGAVALGLFNLRALFSGTILLAFAWAMWSRVWSINRSIKRYREQLSSPLEDAHELGDIPPVSRGRWGVDGAAGSAVADPEGEGGNEENLC